jgi:tRNA dimethylallyltransferase
LFVKGTFFIVGPTAAGKSELAADLACEMGAEIVSADAFQIYHGLNLLTAKPDASTLGKAPHHLIGTTPLDEEMSVDKFRRAASQAIDRINSRGRLAIIVGGSGLYIKALTHGLAVLPEVDPQLRANLNTLSTDELFSQLIHLDPETARKIHPSNRRRLVRALEICLTTGEPASAQRRQWAAVAASLGEARPGDDIARTRRAAHREATTGIFVFRDRDGLYERINRRVEAMFENGVIEEVKAAGAVSSTASQMIGLQEIGELLAGKISILQCVAAIQQATRRYAKRQLTWFRRQTSFEPLNLSLLSHNEARILLRMHLERRKFSAEG